MTRSHLAITSCERSLGWLAAAVIGASTTLLPEPALAHAVGGLGGGFASGSTHPLLGPDHLVAMVAVGLWAALLGRRAIWVLPIVFPLVMALGAVLGMLGVALPGVETGIAASVVILGAVVAIALRPPLWIAAVIVGAFAVFHGHAHGTELPAAASALTYGIGFMLTTAMLHLAGLLIGRAVRTAGERITGIGLALRLRA